MNIAQQDIRTWHTILRKYQRKPFTQHGASHLMGYLRRCAELGELQPDPYIPQWLDCIRLIIRRSQQEENELALVSLYHALKDIARG